MSERWSPDSPAHGRLLLVVCCLVAVAAGGTLVASVSSGGIAGSPIDSVLPGESLAEQDAQGPGPPGVGGDSGQLGALNPGAQTGVGGEISLDNDTFASTDTETHFIAESSQPTYWRTAAYGTYTGSGWERTGETEPYEAPLHDTGFEQIEYNITLEQPAGTLPTPWRPTAVGGVDEDDLVVGPDGSVQPTGVLPAGTTFTGVSHAPQDDPDLLRTVPDTHPSELDRYTALPEDVPPRLAVQTDNIVADAEGRYETAVAVQNWLREAKDYSLQADRETDTIADTFVFEMDAGYCEYFATAMATMLRTQDIPTRYAVGYSSGQQVGDGVYQVRAMNAHAWVEVYFEDVGWVKFDPTPSAARLQTQEIALEEVGEDYEVTDPGSPGETFDPDDFGPDPGSEGWSVALNRTATPGATVEVTLTYDGVPVPGVQLTFNGEPIGRTDDDGTVTGTVPSTDDLEITVVDVESSPALPGDDDFETENEALASGGTSVSRTNLATGTATRAASVSDERAHDEHLTANETGEPVYNETIDIETEADIEISGEVIPGNEVGITALVGDDPVPDARVRVDGEERGRTDEAGWTTITLPADPGPTTIAVEGEVVAGERTVDIPAFEIEVEPELPLALPFGAATVNASYGNDSAVGVPIEVNGETVGTTGPNGQATVRLPPSMSADIAAVQHGVRAETTVGLLLVNLLLVLLVPVALVGAVASLLARRGYRSPAAVAGLGRAAVGAVRESAGGLSGLTTRVVVAAASRGDTLLGEGAASLRDILGLVLVALGLGQPRSGGDNGRTREMATGPAGQTAIEGSDSRAVTDERATVRDAWQRFLAHVSAPATTRTPGELAAHGIQHDGLPAEPVQTLRDAFRATEYGSQPADTDRVRAAIERIEAAVSHGDTGSTGDTDDERASGGAD